MDIKIDKQKDKKQTVEPGDIIEYNDNFDGRWYVVTRQEVNGVKGPNGMSFDGHHWDSDPQSAVDESHATLYKASDYDLVLRRKEVANG